MFLILGLGNIGSRYEKTRHNMGFIILDKFCKDNNIEFNKSNDTSIYGIGNVFGEKVLCVKPKTYMNLSGNALVEIMNYYKIDIDDVVVIYDDITLEFMKIRIREKGSHGGHNGIRDIINKVNTDRFKRIRIGIGENKNIDLSNYVLSNFTTEELYMLENECENILKSIEMIVKRKVSEAMNIFNWNGGVLWDWMKLRRE